MKSDWLITFRSVTYAQRGEQVLRRHGIDCQLRRTPKELSARGCGYCLNLSGRDAQVGVELLREKEIPFERVYAQSRTGRMEERMV